MSRLKSSKVAIIHQPLVVAGFCFQPRIASCADWNRAPSPRPLVGPIWGCCSRRKRAPRPNALIVYLDRMLQAYNSQSLGLWARQLDDVPPANRPVSAAFFLLTAPFGAATVLLVGNERISLDAITETLLVAQSRTLEFSQSTTLQFLLLSISHCLKFSGARTLKAGK